MAGNSGMDRRTFFGGMAVVGGAAVLPGAACASEADARNGFLREPARDVPVAGECDVLVAGGGPAGIAAAVEKAGGEVVRKEGLDDGRWAVVDFGDVILHVFNDDMRLFYHLERLWSDDSNTEKIED